MSSVWCLSFPLGTHLLCRYYCDGAALHQQSCELPCLHFLLSVLNVERRRFVLDAVDGHFARLLQQTSTLGTVLDMVTDRCGVPDTHRSSQVCYGVAGRHTQRACSLCAEFLCWLHWCRAEDRLLRLQGES